MYTPPPSELAPDPSTSTWALLLVAVLLLATALLVVFVSTRLITYHRLGWSIARAKRLSKILVPMIEEKEAAHNLQGHYESASESTQLVLIFH